MDLRIRGKRALICAASRGLGRACAQALAGEGVAVTITGRDAETLARTAGEIGAAGFVVGDIGSEEGRAAALAACPDPDILVTNAGGPPLGRFGDFGDTEWRQALETTMLAPLALIRAVHPGMRERGFGRIVNIGSAYVKAPVELLPLSVGPRAGLTAALVWLAREGTADNVTINTLLPEMILTDRARSGFAHMAREAGEEPDGYMEKAAAALPSRRFGTPEEFGAMCAFLCGVQAGYVTNQNIVIDGGHYPGLF